MPETQPQLLGDSRQRVAFDLMKQIDYYADGPARTAEYYFTLYRQCLKATSGQPLKDILEKEPTS